MQLGPLLPGRIPGSLASSRLTASISDSRQLLTRLQDQLTTGQQFLIPSEAPSAALRTIALQKLLERKLQMAVNVQTNESLLNASDQALSGVSDSLNRAKQLASAGIGTSSNADEKAAMATEVGSLIQQVLGAANTTFRGRFLFGGSQGATSPFGMTQTGSVRYGGDLQSLATYLDLGTLLGNNVDGHTALGGVTDPISTDINPALTTRTALGDLNGGLGVSLGSISVTVDDGVTPVTQKIDLSGARTIGDVKTILENAFTAGSLNVSINAADNGLQLDGPGGGTVTVAEVSGGSTGARLGILGTGAQIVGGDLDPALTGGTLLSSLNGGAGVGVTAGKGLRIANGDTVTIVELPSAANATVEDLLNKLRKEEPNLLAGINAAGNGLAISSRLSGVDFSIGANNADGNPAGDNATALGIRTLTGNTRLADLNYGKGVPVDTGLTLKITRRDALLPVTEVDLAGAKTIQDVINAINAASPATLSAKLNDVGNGISITDTSGTGPLAVASDELSIALGINGTETGADNTVPLVGRDQNPQEVHGSLNLLLRLQVALTNQDDVALGRISEELDTELVRLASARGEVGSRLKLLDDTDNRLKDEEIQIRDSLSQEFDVDIAETLSNMVNQQAAFEATLKMTAQTLQTSLLNYL